VQAGILEHREGSGQVADAVLTDDGLNERQKQVLLEIYDAFRKENAAAPAAAAEEVAVSLVTVTTALPDEALSTAPTTTAAAGARSCRDLGGRSGCAAQVGSDSRREGRGQGSRQRRSQGRRQGRAQGASQGARRGRGGSPERRPARPGHWIRLTSARFTSAARYRARPAPSRPH
jgi:hypothetical protein